MRLEKNVSPLAIAASILALLVFGNPVSGQTTIRPLSDWLSQQGTFCWPDNGGCIVFVPPVANFVGFSSPDRCASVDYAGLADAYLKGASGGAVSVGTTMTGTVVERRLADGRAEVRVVLHTKNALTWVIPADNYVCDFAAGPLLFGRRAPEVLAGGIPSLADLTMDLVFTNTSPGADLPDLMQLLYVLVFGPPDDPRQLQFEGMRAQAKGELRAEFGVPDPTPGHATVVQNGIFMASWKGKLAGGFPVELIRLQPVGK